MLLFGSGIGLIVAIAVWLFCVFDAITTPDAQVRNLPKLAWVFIVVLLADLGAVLWLVLGRPWGVKVPGARAASDTAPGVGPTHPRRAPRGWDAAEAARPAGRRAPTNPDDDEEFLAGLRRRVDEQRRAQEQRDTDPDQG